MTEHQLDKGKCSGRERIIQATKTLAGERPFDDHFTGGKEELRAELVHRGLLDDMPTQNTHLAILEAAVRIFARSGVSAATLEDIAAEAGVTRGTLCWHFHSKDDLVSAIIKHYGPHSILGPIVDQIEQDLQEGVQLDDASIIRRLAEGFYDAFAAQGDFARLAILLIYTHPQAAHVLADMVAKGRKRLTEYVGQRQEAGYFCKHIDPGLFVQVIAMIFAMRAIGRGLNNLLPFSHLSREEIIDQLVSLLLYGMVQRDQFPTDETRVAP